VKEWERKRERESDRVREWESERVRESEREWEREIKSPHAKEPLESLPVIDP
jgi:hypothetical protein